MTESQQELNKSFDNNITQLTAIIEEQTKSLQSVIDVAQALIERVKKLESLGLKEYTVITNDSSYHVTIPIDSSITYDTFAKYCDNNKK